MIKSFADKRTREFFAGGRVPAFAAFVRQAERRMTALETAQTMRTLQALPSNRFEALGGDRLGQYSIRINDQWRICFRWESGAHAVEIVDYH